MIAVSLLSRSCAALVAAAALAACASESTAPGPVPSATLEQLKDPASCQGCHPDHHKEWSGSMHAYAGEDPVFRAMNARGQRETKGELGTFCVNCHAPLAVRDGATKDGLNLDDLPASQRGVTCYFCHAADKVHGSHDAPVDLADDLVMRGSITDPVANTAHASTYSSLLDRTQLESASFCGSCHDIVSPLGAHIERTYAEWRATVFSKPPAELPCGECHMQSREGLAADFPGTSSRTLHAHTFPAIDVALTDFPEKDAQRAAVQDALDSTIQAALCVKNAGGLSNMNLVLDNVGAGHAFPSGASQDRRLWAEVTAYAKGDVVYQSGVVPMGKSVTDILAADPDTWLLRDCMFDAAGKKVDMFWQAATDRGDALPAPTTLDPMNPAYYATHVGQAFPRAAGDTLPAQIDHATAKLHLVPVGFDVLEDLVKSGDLDAKVRDAMPTFDLAGVTLDWTQDKSTIQYTDGGFFVYCVAVGLTRGANTGVAAPPASCP